MEAKRDPLETVGLNVDQRRIWGTLFSRYRAAGYEEHVATAAAWSEFKRSAQPDSGEWKQMGLIEQKGLTRLGQTYNPFRLAESTPIFGSDVNRIQSERRQKNEVVEVWGLFESTALISRQSARAADRFAMVPLTRDREGRIETVGEPTAVSLGEARNIVRELSQDHSRVLYRGLYENDAVLGADLVELHHDMRNGIRTLRKRVDEANPSPQENATPGARFGARSLTGAGTDLSPLRESPEEGASRVSNMLTSGIKMPKTIVDDPAFMLAHKLERLANARIIKDRVEAASLLRSGSATRQRFTPNRDSISTPEPWDSISNLAKRIEDHPSTILILSQWDQDEILNLAEEIRSYLRALLYPSARGVMEGVDRPLQSTLEEACKKRSAKLTEEAHKALKRYSVVIKGEPEDPEVERPENSEEDETVKDEEDE